MWPEVAVPDTGNAAACTTPNGDFQKNTAADAEPSQNGDSQKNTAPGAPDDTSSTNGKDQIRIKQMGCPIALSVTPPEYRHAGYPEGYHTEEILSGLGYSPEEIREMSE